MHITSRIRHHRRLVLAVSSGVEVSGVPFAADAAAEVDEAVVVGTVVVGTVVVGTAAAFAVAAL